MSTPIRAVFLDFQDTLARFREGAWNSSYGLYVEAAREHGIALDPTSVLLPTDEAWADFQTPDGPAHPTHSGDAASYGLVRIAVHRRRLARAGITGEVADAIGRRIDELEGQSERYALYDDVIPALDRLREADVAAIIVSNHVWRLADVVGELGLGGRVAAVVNSAHVGYRKPHPAIYRYALGVSGLPAEETVMVGDSRSHDVVGAERQGIHGVLLVREGHADRAGHAGQAVTADVPQISTLMEIPLLWP